MHFPEEPLDLPAHEGGGYIHAHIGDTLNKGRLTIARKLGWGPRSSVWLVWDTNEECHYSVKIYTLAISPHASTVEVSNVRCSSGTNFSAWLPSFQRKFWEETNNGAHFCVVSNPCSTSILHMLQTADDSRLPIDAVQKVVRNVADAVAHLHNSGIMYGGIKPENVLFREPTDVEALKSILDSEPRPTTIKVKKYTTVRSQPLPHTFTYKGKKSNVPHWSMCLVGFGHAQRDNYQPEKGYDYASAPETLLHDATCSPQTDTWMLGCMTFHLLTGTHPFHPKRTASKTIAHMSSVLGDDNLKHLDPIPEAWLRDKNMKDYASVAAGQGEHNYVITLRAALAESLEEDEMEGALEFISGCLRLDPEKRITMAEATSHKWLRKVNACSCGFCKILRY